MQQDGQLIVTAGASRSGKTEITRRETKNSQRLIVWDPKAAWAKLDNCQLIKTRRALLQATKNNRGPARLAFCSPHREDFNFFAQTAFWWGRLSACDVVAEEIANVTSPNKAPRGWHLLLSQGLEFGINIHAITQRPVESDKTCMGNATIVRTFRMSREADRVYMSRELDLDPGDIRALEPLMWIARNLHTAEKTTGKLTF